MSLRRRIVLFGHTHLPVVYRLHAGGIDGALGKPGDAVPVGTLPESRWLFNPGSVGQPRDGIPLAAYGLLDLVRGVMTFRRAAYDVAAYQALMHRAGLPRELADRLEVGA